MEEGCIMTPSFGVDRKIVGSWFGGQLEPSFYSGLTAPKEGQLPITAFRCGSCGLVEMYTSPSIEQ